MPARVASGVPLPVVSFRKVEEEKRPFGVHDQQARSYGYNDFSDFTRPEHYIRYIEPIDTELAHQVEYDMDEQDQEWIDSINAERKKEQMDQVTYETFEVIIDRLEKEYFELAKRLPKHDTGLPAEDSTCAICDDGEGENSNAIVFCDGCNLAVHQDCYGVPYIPEGQWLCRKCTVSPETPVSCALCPNEGGAFKLAEDGRWAHLLCSIFVPEVVVGNQIFQEPITLTKVPKSRWKLVCSICKFRMGACIQCDNRACFTAFHVTCARKYKFLCPMKNLPGQDTALRAYCERHLPADMLEAHNEAVEQIEREEEEQGAQTPGGGERSPKSSKFARAHAKTYRTGPPLVPSIIVDNIVEYIGKVTVRKKVQFVLSVCKYWSLKREARRGAPLLKRLHLEPWTTSSSKQQTEEEKKLKLVHLTRLRKDLEKVRMLAELVRKREKEKLRQLQCVTDVLATCLFPHEPQLRFAFERITAIDRQDWFRHPVSRAEHPDYYTTVINPMFWTTIDQNLERHQYWDVRVFTDHINLVLDNVMLYNPADSPYHKLANKIKTSAAPILQSLESLKAPNSTADSVTVGDLEPSLDVLDLLFDVNLMEESTEIYLDTDPIDFLFRYELAKSHPGSSLPPPPVPKPPKHRRRNQAARKRDRERERPRPPRDPEAEKRKRAERVAAWKERERETTFTGLPRTRSARLVTAEFGAETVGSENDSGYNLEANATMDATSQSELLVDPGTHIPVGMLPPMKLVSSRKRALPSSLATLQALAPSARAVSDPTSSPNGSGVSVSPNFQDFQAALATNPRKRKRFNEEDKPGDMPLVVNSVGDRDSFAMFNRGWVLPVGMKRMPRTPSAVPTVLTAAIPPIGRTGSSGSKAERRKSKLNPSISSSDLNMPASFSQPQASGSGSHAPPATPQTVLTDHADPFSSDLSEVSDQEHTDPTDQAPQQFDSNSDSSGLSDVPSEDDDGDEYVVGRQRNRNRKQSQTVPPASTQDASVPDIHNQRRPPSQRYEGGTLVWGKTESFPFWPAVVWEDDDPAVPPHIRTAKPAPDVKSVQPDTQHLTLVQYYDAKRTWAWLTPSKIQPFGEDQALDQSMLSQRFRSDNMKHSCRQAYRNAVAEMETEAEKAEAAEAVKT